MLVVVAIHGLLTLADRHVTRSWIVPWLGGIVIGSAAYVRVWRPMRETADELGRNFRPVFPRDLGYALLGGSLLAVILVAILVLPPMWKSRAGTGWCSSVRSPCCSRSWGSGSSARSSLPPVLPVAPAPDRDRRGGGGRAPTAAVLLSAAIVVVQLFSSWPRLTQDYLASRDRRRRVFNRVDDAGGSPVHH